MKSIVRYAILGILVLGVVILSGYLYKTVRQNQLLSGFVKNQDGLINYIASNNQLQCSLQGSLFDNSQKFTTLNGEDIQLLDTIRNSAIVFYTGQSYCSSCVQDIVANFGENFNVAPELQVVVLFDNCSKRSLYDISLGFGIKNASLLATTSIILPDAIMQNLTPFIFTIDSSSHFDNVFIPIRDNGNYNTKYYQAVISKMSCGKHPL